MSVPEPAVAPTPRSRRLLGKVAVVTGSSGGIGWAIAYEFAREGASVVINSRDAQRAGGAAAALEHDGLQATAFAADIRDPVQARALASAAVERFGRLDVWVNNAGINVIKPALELEPDEWTQVIDTNLSGCFYGAQAAARHMVPQKSGVIIQIGSIIGEVGLPRRVPYTAAKHGLIGLTKVLGAEWAKDNVRVVCLDPGYISAGLGVKSQTRGGAFTAADIERRTPMGRFGEAVEVARVAVFLASDDASYITGSHITVDGGWVAYGGW
jgi:3-oxoacyl-[acyl-carrier protein] reductase